MLSKRTKLKAIALLHYLAPPVATVRLSNLWAQVLQVLQPQGSTSSSTSPKSVRMLRPGRVSPAHNRATEYKNAKFQGYIYKCQTATAYKTIDK